MTKALSRKTKKAHEDYMEKYRVYFNAYNKHQDFLKRHPMDDIRKSEVKRIVELCQTEEVYKETLGKAIKEMNAAELKVYEARLKDFGSAAE